MSFSIENLRIEYPNHTFNEAPTNLNSRSFEIILNVSTKTERIFVIDVLKLNKVSKRYVLGFFRFMREQEQQQQQQEQHEPYVDPKVIIMYKGATLPLYETVEKNKQKLKYFIKNRDDFEGGLCGICCIEQDEFCVCDTCGKQVCIECIKMIKRRQGIEICPYCRCHMWTPK